MNESDRRGFIKNSLLAGLGLSLWNPTKTLASEAGIQPVKKVGMIGLDTGHSPAFVKTLNTASGNEYGNYKVVAAYPKGTELITEWKNRIPEFTAEVQQHGVEIVDSIPRLLELVDYVILTTIDGNKHLEQAMPVFEAGLPVFIDKPFAASLEDARKLASAADRYKTPMFSASSLRFLTDAQAVRDGSLGRVNSVEAYSPAHIEEHHPDLFWYGVHGVEILFTLLGRGCQWVERTFTPDTDLVVGMWEGDRIGTFRGIRKGTGGYGGMVYAENGIQLLNDFKGYDGLLREIVRFFDTGNPPVQIEETLEIFSFMQAAEKSKEMGGKRVLLADL